MKGPVVIYSVLLIGGLAVCDGIAWLQVIRKQSNNHLRQLFGAVALLIGIVGMSVFVAFNH
jgi:hypothetical protein